MRWREKYFVLSCMAAVILLNACQSEFYSADDFEQVKKVDAHIHYLGPDTAFTAQAKADHFILIDINYDDKDYMSLDSMELFSLKQKTQFPGQLEYVASFNLENWNAPNWVSQTIQKLDASFKKGAMGVKIWKNIGMKYKDADSSFIMIDHPRVDSVIQFISDQNKTLIAHIAEPKNCWLPLDKMTTSGDREYFTGAPEYHMFLHPEYPSYQTLMDARDRVVAKHPALNFVGAHMGSLEWDVDELAKRLDRFPNMAVDLSARLAHWQYQSQKDFDKVRSFVIKHQDQLIYGSDEFIEIKTDAVAFKKKMHDIWRFQWRYLVTDDRMTSDQIKGSFKGLKLPRSVIDKIYWSNAVKWYRINTGNRQ